MFEKIFDEIKRYPNIVIHRHGRPDGDAIGSQVGLKHILKAAFPEKNIYVVGDDAGRYSFMDDCVMDEIADGVYENALAIVLDCGGENMVSDDRYRLAASSVRIDHHMPTGAFTDLEVSDPSFESCCGEITAMAMELDLPVPPLAAKSLYTGMVTDSGRFRYDCTNARTFRMAAFLMDHGVDLNQIYPQLYADDFAYKRLRAEYTLKIRFTPKNVAYIYTTKEELTASSESPFSISRGMVGTMSDIRGVSIWANFTETEEGVLCELRSADKSIVEVAMKYGGGGHAKACGATVPDRETAMAMLQDLDKMIKE